MGTSIAPRRYRVNIGKAIAWVLVVCGVAFSAFSMVNTIEAVRTATDWPRAHAVVAKISVSGFGHDKLALIAIEFLYQSGVEKRHVWAYLSPPFRGQNVVEKYAAGTAHVIYLDPKDHARAKVGVGWNLNYVFVPVFTGCIAGVLFWAALYLFRLDERNR